jgi:hypothetical protein
LSQKTGIKPFRGKSKEGLPKGKAASSQPRSARTQSKAQASRSNAHGSAIVKSKQVGTSRPRTIRPSDRVKRSIRRILLKGFTTSDDHKRGYVSEKDIAERKAIKKVGMERLLAIAAHPEPEAISLIVEEYGNAIQRLNPRCSDTQLLVRAAPEDIAFDSDVQVMLDEINTDSGVVDEQSASASQPKFEANLPLRRSPRPTLQPAISR